ncbi:unnamed protein product [Boreogadus saida]
MAPCLSARCPPITLIGEPKGLLSVSGCAEVWSETTGRSLAPSHGRQHTRTDPSPRPRRPAAPSRTGLALQPSLRCGGGVIEAAGRRQRTIARRGQRPLTAAAVYSSGARRRPGSCGCVLAAAGRVTRGGGGL